MKLAYSMLGIAAVLILWMTVSFLRPIPTQSYEHYSASIAPVEVETTAQAKASEDTQ